jgi:hypothetical protein
MPVSNRFVSPGVFTGDTSADGVPTPLGGDSTTVDSGTNVTSNALSTDLSGTALIRPQGISGVSQRVPLANSIAPETGRIQFNQQPIPEPQRSYDFRVMLPSMPGVGVPIAEATEAVPLESTTPSPEAIGGRYKKVAGMYDCPPLPLVLYHNQASDGIQGHVALEYLRAWKGLVQNEDGTYNYPISYKKSIFVEYRNVDQNTGYIIEYRGCFPLNAQPIRLQYQQSTRTVIMATFSVERILPNAQLGGLTSGGVTVQPYQSQGFTDQQTFAAQRTSRGVPVLSL